MKGVRFMKKVLALVLCLMLLGSVAMADVVYNAPGEYPIANEIVTIKILAPQDGEYSRAENLQTLELEEKLGIKIEWEIAPSGSMQDKLSTVFLRDPADQPDIILTGVGAADRLSMIKEAELGAQGYILPLNEYLDTVSVGYKAAFENLPGLRDYITTPDGNIYSLPNVDGSLHVQYNMKLWLNTTWLENLGLEMPTTTDEFYEVLKAFKEEDANGNGDPDDEIPLSGVKSGAGTQIDGFLMAPFQLTPENSKLYVDDGVVTFAPVTDGYREGLKYLNTLYEEGLLNPESFTQDKNNQVNINEAGDVCVIGAFLAQRPGYACDLSTYPGNSKKWEQYQPIAPLTNSETGQCVAAWNPYVMYQTGMTFITAACKEPEAAFRLIDYLATQEGSIRSAYGIEGKQWRYAVEGEYGLDGEPAYITSIPNSDTNVSWTQLAGLIRDTRFTVWLTTNPDPYAEGVKPLDGRQVLLYKGSKLHEAVRQDLDSVMPSLYFSEDISSKISKLSTDVNDMQKQLMVKFINGDLDIDDDNAWNSYLADLETAGLSEYLELYQQAYDNSAFSK